MCSVDKDKRQIICLHKWTEVICFCPRRMTSSRFHCNLSRHIGHHFLAILLFFLILNPCLEIFPNKTWWAASVAEIPSHNRLSWERALSYFDRIHYSQVWSGGLLKLNFIWGPNRGLRHRVTASELWSNRRQVTQLYLRSMDLHGYHPCYLRTLLECLFFSSDRRPPRDLSQHIA